MDIEMSGRDVDVRTGVEWKIASDALRLRGGFRLEGLAYGANLTFGAGLRASPSVSLDYAFWLRSAGRGNAPSASALNTVFNDARTNLPSSVLVDGGLRGGATDRPAGQSRSFLGEERRSTT